MFVMITATYPLNKQPEVGEVWSKARESPSPLVKTHHTLVKADLECGVKVYTILEVEEGKEDEGLWAIGQRMQGYFGIEGYAYSMDVVWEAEEALARQAAQTG